MVYRSRLTNAVLEPGYRNFNDHYVGIMEEYNFLHDRRRSVVDDYRRLRMISKQYVRSRSKVQSVIDLREASRWITANQMLFYGVPMVFMMESPARAQFFTALWFSDASRDSINTIYYHGTWVEEAIEGPGWSGSLELVLPRRLTSVNPRCGRSPIFDMGVFRRALASFGIYTQAGSWSRPATSSSTGHCYSLAYSILDRDFPLLDPDHDEWSAHQIDPDEDDDLDEISEGEMRARLIEEGFDDEGDITGEPIDWR